MRFIKLATRALLTAGMLSLAMSAYASTSIKCWTNSEGVRECGNSVPPEYSQQEYRELSEQGIIIDYGQRALTDEELAEQRHQAALEAERERELQQQRRQDAILLQTFSSERDISTARDDKLMAMDAQVKLAESRIDKLRGELDKRIEKAAADERSGKVSPPELLEDIESLRRQIHSNEAFIAETRASQETLEATYNADIERFRKLKNQ